MEIHESDDEWTPRFAYAVGLLASDGGITGRKPVALESKDKVQIATFLSCIGATNPIGRNEKAYRVQINDVRFYRWLESIGVTARKSLTLGMLSVPGAGIPRLGARAVGRRRHDLYGHNDPESPPISGARLS